MYLFWRCMVNKAWYFKKRFFYRRCLVVEHEHMYGGWPVFVFPPGRGRSSGWPPLFLRIPHPHFLPGHKTLCMTTPTLRKRKNQRALAAKGSWRGQGLLRICATQRGKWPLMGKLLQDHALHHLLHLQHHIWRIPWKGRTTQFRCVCVCCDYHCCYTFWHHSQ